MANDNRPQLRYLHKDAWILSLQMCETLRTRCIAAMLDPSRELRANNVRSTEYYARLVEEWGVVIEEKSR